MGPRGCQVMCQVLEIREQNQHMVPEPRRWEWGMGSGGDCSGGRGEHEQTLEREDREAAWHTIKTEGWEGTRSQALPA